MWWGKVAAANSGQGDVGDSSGIVPNRRDELLTFLVTTFVLIPGASVAFVGAFGLAIWVTQMIFGPPGPPG